MLAVLRGEDGSVRDGALDFAFACLCEKVADSGLVIQEPGTPYLGDDELTLLSWLAAAQRIAFPGPGPAGGELAAAVDKCAVLLEEAGLRLYPLTLYQHRLQGPG